jgi:hypothetical protein
MRNRCNDDMNASDDNHLDLERQLDEAGRLCQPRHAGWATLLERLPPQGPGERGAARRESTERASPRRRLGWKILAVAAGLVAAIVLGLSLWLGPHGGVQAETLPIEVQRRGIQVTIFSAGDNREPTLYMPVAANPAQPSPGMALVKDQRMILHLQKGDNLVKFTDVAATIDPTSVRLVSDTDPLGMRVVEQNFEFDLASADGLLKRSLEQKITCVGKEGGGLYEGYLLSYDNATVVLADKQPSDDPKAARPKTETISRDQLQAIRLDHKPADLYTRPTLVWKLRTDRPGDHLTTLTYLCGDAVWRADYVAVIRQSGAEGDTLDLKAWVTIDNRSGTTYENAGLKLIAGDVNRVRDPWAPVPRRAERAFFADLDGSLNLLATLAPKEFVEKSFFEYKLYTLNQPSTIKDRQIKQLSLFRAEDVKARRRYVCRSNEGSNLHPEVELLLKNEKENHLGRPLPKGMVTLTAVDPDGDNQMLARQQIDHTAKDEELKLDMGRAPDVVYGYRVVETQRPSPYRMIRTYEFRIRNHKPYEVQVRAVAEVLERQAFWRYDRLPNALLRGVRELREAKNWEIIDATDKFSKHDDRTVCFDVRVAADSEKTITYTVDYEW